MTGTPRRILGLDPGLRLTGWGIIEQNGHRLYYVAHGTIKVADKLEMDLRLAQLYHGLQEVINNYAPDAAAVEETFLNKNPATTLKLGLARGVVMVAPAMTGLRVGEYSANHVKKTVVGAGHADKEQVKAMVKFLLPNCGNVSADEADALAVAICHAHTLQTQQQWVKAS
jgi:crossover junction endodeoxyribonuclease RuvC